MIVFESIQKLKGHNSCVMCTYQISENIIATGGLDKTVRIWNLKKNECIKILNGHQDCVTGLTFLKEDNLISSSDDHSLRLWCLTNFVGIKKYSEHTDSVSCVTTFKGDNSQLFCLKSEQYMNNLFFSGSWDKTIKIWSIKSTKSIATLIAHSSPVRCMAFKFNEKEKNWLLLSGGNGQEIIVWDLFKLSPIQKLDAHTAALSGINVLRNNKIISASLDRFIKIWNNDLTDCIKIKADAGFINSLTFKGKFIIFSTGYNFVEIWNSDSIERVFKCQLDSKTIFGVFPLFENKIAVNIGNEVNVCKITNIHAFTLFMLKKFLSGIYNNKYVIMDIFFSIFKDLD